MFARWNRMAKQFARIGKDITIAVRSGGPDPNKIPATILSRCQRFDFRRIATGQIVAHLQQIAREEQLQLEDSLLYAIAREAEGSMRDAQSLLEQVLAFSVDGQVDAEVLDLLGVIDRHSVHRVGRAILGGDPHTCLEVVAGSLPTRNRYQTVLPSTVRVFQELGLSCPGRRRGCRLFGPAR